MIYLQFTSRGFFFFWLLYTLQQIFGLLMLIIPPCEKGFLPCSCQTLGFTHVWHAVKLVWLSSVMMFRSKVPSCHCVLFGSFPKPYAKVWDWLHIVWVWSTVPPGVDRIEPVESVTIVQGSLVTLSCEARGVPPPTLTWLKDGHPLSLHRNRLLDGQETRLQLPDVTPSDAGLYSCVASNQAGSSTKTFNLTVLGNHTETSIFKTKTEVNQQYWPNVLI